MRIMGFSRKWQKLSNPEFTTFRFKRRDKQDWQVGECVQIVYKPRSKEREKLGVAEIVKKEPRDMVLGRPHKYPIATLDDVIADGFNHYWEMWDWLVETYPRQRIYNEPMNLLALRWVK